MPKTFVITPFEEDVLRALEKTRNLKDAAKLLDLKLGTASARLSRLRFRYEMSRTFCDQYDQWMRRLPGKYL